MTCINEQMLTTAEQKITASKEVGLVIWRSHIEGAMSLVKDWGEKMLQSPSSMKLFNAVRLQIVCRSVLQNPSNTKH